MANACGVVFIPVPLSEGCDRIFLTVKKFRTVQIRYLFYRCTLKLKFSHNRPSQPTVVAFEFLDHVSVSMGALFVGSECHFKFTLYNSPLRVFFNQKLGLCVLPVSLPSAK